MLQVQIVDKKFCNRISLNSDYNVNRKLLEEQKKETSDRKKKSECFDYFSTYTL